MHWPRRWKCRQHIPRELASANDGGEDGHEQPQGRHQPITAEPLLADEIEQREGKQIGPGKETPCHGGEGDVLAPGFPGHGLGASLQSLLDDLAHEVGADELLAVQSPQDEMTGEGDSAEDAHAGHPSPQ